MRLASLLDVDRLGNVVIIKAPYYGGYKFRFGEMREGAVYKLVIKEGGCYEK